MLPKYNPEEALCQPIEGLPAEVCEAGTKVRAVGLYGHQRLSVQDKGQRVAVTGEEFDTLQVSNIKWYPRRGSNSRLRLRRPALYPLSYRGTLP